MSYLLLKEYLELLAEKAMLDEVQDFKDAKNPKAVFGKYLFGPDQTIPSAQNEPNTPEEDKLARDLYQHFQGMDDPDDNLGKELLGVVKPELQKGNYTNVLGPSNRTVYRGMTLSVEDFTDIVKMDKTNIHKTPHKGQSVGGGGILVPKTEDKTHGTMSWTTNPKTAIIFARGKNYTDQVYAIFTAKAKTPGNNFFINPPATIKYYQGPFKDFNESAEKEVISVGPVRFTSVVFYYDPRPENNKAVEKMREPGEALLHALGVRKKNPTKRAWTWSKEQLEETIKEVLQEQDAKDPDAVFGQYLFGPDQKSDAARQEWNTPEEKELANDLYQHYDGSDNMFSNALGKELLGVVKPELEKGNYTKIFAPPKNQPLYRGMKLTVDEFVEMVKMNKTDVHQGPNKGWYFGGGGIMRPKIGSAGQFSTMSWTTDPRMAAIFALGTNFSGLIYTVFTADAQTPGNNFFINPDTTDEQYFKGPFKMHNEKEVISVGSVKFTDVAFYYDEKARPEHVGKKVHDPIDALLYALGVRKKTPKSTTRDPW